MAQQQQQHTRPRALPLLLLGAVCLTLASAPHAAEHGANLLSALGALEQRGRAAEVSQPPLASRALPSRMSLARTHPR